jgi:hypothetical protein
MRISLILATGLLMTLSSLAACSDDTGGGGVTTDTATATDSGGAVDAAGDATATTDAGKTATDSGGAVDAAGDATATTDAGKTAKYGAGCTSTDDTAFRKLLGDDTAKGDEFRGVVKDCTLTKGCLSKADEAAKVSCISDCIATAPISTTGKLSLDCATCYGHYKGYCGAAKCITFCAVDAASAGCSKCLADNCDPEYELCVAGDK